MINYLAKFIQKAPIFLPLLIRNRTIFQVHAPAGRRKLELYKKIKEKEMRGIKDNKLDEQSRERFYRQLRCDGCNSALQSEDKQKYGFIK